MFTTCVFLCSRYAVEPVCSPELESSATHIHAAAASGGQVSIAIEEEELIRGGLT